MRAQTAAVASAPADAEPAPLAGTNTTARAFANNLVGAYIVLRLLRVLKGLRNVQRMSWVGVLRARADGAAGA